MPRGEAQGFDPQKLRDRRKACGYTVEVLAGLANIAPPTLTSWETGRRTPTATRLAVVAGILGVSTRELMDRDRTTLSNLREDAGLSRQQVSAAIGRSPVTLGQFEKGRTPPHAHDVEYLAALYKVTPAEVRAAAEASAANWQEVLTEARNTRGPQPAGASRNEP